MAKLAALLLLGYLLYGTVFADWIAGGEVTAKYSTWILAGAAAVVGLHLLGMWVAARYSRFMGFSRWQWGVFAPAALAIGVVVRMTML